MNIVAFEWDEWNTEKIYHHRVTPDEVEQCFFNKPQWHKRKPTNIKEQERFYLMGYTDSGRLLFRKMRIKK